MRNGLNNSLLLLGVNALMMLPPPSPFLDARDLNARYASQVRKLSNAPWVEDGDGSFTQVDTFRPAHELEAGVAADAVNKRFEDGRAWPRFGVLSQAWGTVSANLAAGLAWGRAHAGDGLYTVEVDGFVVGRKYVYAAVESTQLTTAQGVQVGGVVPSGVTIAPGTFTATQTTYYLWAAAAGLQAVVVKSKILVHQAPQGYCRFNDPQGVDTQVLVTDDWRTGMGEDGGRGRAWRIQSGAGPVQIPMNGHDIWGPSRLIPCFNGLVLLRQGNERHYFTGTAVGANTIQLNALPAWKDGDQVNLYQDAMNFFTFTGVDPANPIVAYYVKTDPATNIARLYKDAALGTQITWTGATGTQFYIERRATAPGFYGNGAPPLLAQPRADIGNTLFEIGFKSAPTIVAITGTNNANNVATALNHRLLPGDAVLVTGLHTTGNALLPPCYAYPTSDNTLLFYGNLLDALGNTGNNVIPLINNGETGTVKKSGASGLPMPPGREGCYYQNRLVIVNGRDGLLISDALDPLHYAPLTDAITANLGESGNIQSVTPFGNDSLLIEKEDVGGIFLLGNFSGGPDAWTLTNITREYGQLAPLSGAQVGVDFWALSRKGVQSVTQTVQGITQGVAAPVSKPMKKYIDQIDWRYAGGSAAAYWNNRYFIAVPLKGQAGTPVNNGVLVYNFLNGGWEGLWQGAGLQVYGFARLAVFGEERLCFVNYASQVCWLTDAFSDNVNGVLAPIADSLTTRRYMGGDPTRKLWLAALVQWDTYAPSLTVTAVGPGVNKTQGLLPAPVTYDRTKYFMAGQADYDAANPTQPAWAAADREDYSLATNELLVSKLDTHQNIAEPFRMRMDDWGVQLTIANAAGSARIQSVMVRGVSGPGTERQKS